MPEEKNEIVTTDDTIDTDVVNEIIAACNALETVQEIDTALMTKEDDKRKKRIARKSLAIIDYHINYLYACLYDDKDDED